MPICTVTLIANAGIVLTLNGHTIWIDALHTSQVRGFSTVSLALWEKMHISLPPPELLFFTHCHPDHYSQQLVQEAHILWPGAKLVLPQQEFCDQILISGREVRFSSGSLALRFLRLPHEGDTIIPHYGLLLSNNGYHILIAGDCETACPVLANSLNSISIDLAVLNFPWATLRRGVQFLEEILHPRHLLLCHLPFPEDDINDYLSAARRAARALSLPDTRLLSRPLQKETI